MRTDVRNDPAKILFIKEPIRTSFRSHAVWSHANRLNHFANSTRFYQLTRLYSTSVFMPFAVHYRVNTLGFFLNTAHICQLFE